MFATRQAKRSSVLTRLAAAALTIGLGFGAMDAPASAQDFLVGQSNGMNKCVRAILRGYTVKRVNVHGHHFNCHPLKRFDEGRRVISLDRNRRGQSDDHWTVNFRVVRVGAREIVVTDSATVRTLHGLYRWDYVVPGRFAEPSRGPAPRRDYAYYVDQARNVRPVERKHWDTVAKQITSIVIAQIGEPWP